MLVTNRIRSECFEKVFENSANHNWSIFLIFVVLIGIGVFADFEFPFEC